MISYWCFSAVYHTVRFINDDVVTTLVVTTSVISIYQYMTLYFVMTYCVTCFCMYFLEASSPLAQVPMIYIPSSKVPIPKVYKANNISLNNFWIFIFFIIINYIHIWYSITLNTIYANSQPTIRTQNTQSFTMGQQSIHPVSSNSSHTHRHHNIVSRIFKGITPKVNLQVSTEKCTEPQLTCTHHITGKCILGYIMFNDSLKS